MKIYASIVQAENMEYKRTSVNIPMDVYDRLEEVANKEFDGNKSQLMVKALRFYFDQGEPTLFRKIQELETDVTNLKSQVRMLVTEIPDEIQRRRREAFKKSSASVSLEDLIENKVDIKSIETREKLIDALPFKHQKQSVDLMIEYLQKNDMLEVVDGKYNWDMKKISEFVDIDTTD